MVPKIRKNGSWSPNQQLSIQKYTDTYTETDKYWMALMYLHTLIQY